MMIKKIHFENFRNFEALDLSLNLGFIVLTGPNGAGKTNFLEAIYFGASLRRFPESELGQLFRDGTGFLRTRLICRHAEDEELEAAYEKVDGGFRSQLKINGQALPRHKYAGRLPVVSFLPQDLNLLTRSPAQRRRYLDETLSMASAEYRHHLAQYQQTLRQRNELLGKIKAGAGGQEGLLIWDEQLAEHGSRITGMRLVFFEYLKAHFDSVLAKVSLELQDVKLLYRNSGLADKQQFLAAILGLRRREAEAGVTVIGPHRDDFEAEVGGLRAAGYLSRGQIRSITLALKILEKEYLGEGLRRPAILLLDDVFSEFDREHQEKLVAEIAGSEQVLLTTAHLEEIKNFLPKNTEILQVSAGRVSPG